VNAPGYAITEERIVMQVKDLGYEITGGPGVEYCRVTANDDGTADIVLKLTYLDKPIGFGLDELQQFIEALQVLHSCADKVLLNNRRFDGAYGS
jgi:hypothetical protein